NNFSLFALGDVGESRENTGLAVQFDQIGRHQAGAQLAVFHTEVGFDLTYRPALAQALESLYALFWVDPQPDLKRGSAQHFFACESRDGEKALVDLYKLPIGEPCDSQNDRPQAEGGGEPGVGVLVCRLAHWVDPLSLMPHTGFSQTRSPVRLRWRGIG